MRKSAFKVSPTGQEMSALFSSAKTSPNNQIGWQLSETPSRFGTSDAKAMTGTWTVGGFMANDSPTEDHTDKYWAVGDTYNRAETITPPMEGEKAGAKFNNTKDYTNGGAPSFCFSRGALFPLDDSPLDMFDMEGYGAANFPDKLSLGDMSHKKRRYSDPGQQHEPVKKRNREAEGKLFAENEEDALGAMLMVGKAPVTQSRRASECIGIKSDFMEQEDRRRRGGLKLKLPPVNSVSKGSSPPSSGSQPSHPMIRPLAQSSVSSLAIPTPPAQPDQPHNTRNKPGRSIRTLEQPLTVHSFPSQTGTAFSEPTRTQAPMNAINLQLQLQAQQQRAPQGNQPYTVRLPPVRARQNHKPQISHSQPQSPTQSLVVNGQAVGQAAGQATTSPGTASNAAGQATGPQLATSPLITTQYTNAQPGQLSMPLFHNFSHLLPNSTFQSFARPNGPYNPGAQSPSAHRGCRSTTSKSPPQSPSPPPYISILPEGNAYKHATWSEIFARVMEILKRDKIRQKVMAVEVGFSGSTLSSMLHGKYRHTKEGHVARLRDWCFSRDSLLISSVRCRGENLSEPQLADMVGVSHDLFKKYVDFTLPVPRRKEVETVMTPWLRTCGFRNTTTRSPFQVESMALPIPHQQPLALSAQQLSPPFLPNHSGVVCVSPAALAPCARQKQLSLQIQQLQDQQMQLFQERVLMSLMQQNPQENARPEQSRTSQPALLEQQLPMPPSPAALLPLHAAVPALEATLPKGKQQQVGARPTPLERSVLAPTLAPSAAPRIKEESKEPPATTTQLAERTEEHIMDETLQMGQMGGHPPMSGQLDALVDDVNQASQPISALFEQRASSSSSSSSSSSEPPSSCHVD